jgi:hypothetical protein
MKKSYSGDLYDKNMWCATKSFTISEFHYFLGKIEEKVPKAIKWLDENHPYVWSRSKFGENFKVDYINNNLSESFNSWVSKTKDFHIVEMLDHIRQMIIKKFVSRFKIGTNMSGIIILAIISNLNAKTKSIKDHEVLICGPAKAKVTVNRFRHVVNFDEKICSYRAWQVTEKPCSHAVAFIAMISREVQMDEFVHEYFSIDRFTKAYASKFNPMTSKDQWTHVDFGYKIKKPKMRRKPRRPRKSRIKPHDEVATTKKRKMCSEYNELGHTAKTCQGGPTASQKRR